MESLDAREWVDAAFAHLADAGLQVELQLDDDPVDGQDASVWLGWAGDRQRFAVVLKRSLRPSTSVLTMHRLAARPDALLVAPVVSGQVAEMAREMGVAYLDAAGNAWIRGEHFLIDVRGRRTPSPVSDSAAAFTKTDLRVILAMMVEPEAVNETTRALAERIGISHGAVHLAQQKLTRRGLLAESGLRRGRLLLDEWTQAYLSRNGAHRTSRTVYVDQETDLQQLGLISGVQISGELAAERLGWPIRGVSGIVYAPTLATVARTIRVRSHGVGKPLEVRTPVLASSDNEPGLAASILIRADMLASREARQIEVAQEALEHDQNLRRLVGLG